MTRRHVGVCATVLMCLVAVPALASDIVVLQDGNRVMGRVQHSSGIGFFLRGDDAQLDYFLWSDVRDIKWAQPSSEHLRHYLVWQRSQDPITATQATTPRPAAQHTSRPDRSSASRVARATIAPAVMPTTSTPAARVAAQVPAPPVLTPARVPSPAAAAPRAATTSVTPVTPPMSKPPVRSAQPAVRDALPAVQPVTALAPPPQQIPPLTVMGPDADELYARGETYLEQFLQTRDRALLQQAHAMYAQMLNDQPDAANAHARLADVMLMGDIDTHTTDTALRSAQRALELAPHDGQVHRTLAHVYMARQQVEAALKHAQLALTHDAEDPRTHLTLAHVHEQAGEHRPAVQHYQHAFKHAAANTRMRGEAATSIAKLYRSQLQQPQRAIPWYERALELTPDEPLTWNAYGIALQDVGRFDEAEAAYRRALSLDEFRAPRNNLAHLYYHQGALEQAEQEYARLRDGQSLTAVSRAYAKRGDLDAAQRVAQVALDMDPGNADAAYLVGVDATKRHDWPAARAAFEQAMFVDPAYASAHYGLGYVAVQTGDNDKAIAHYQSALELDPDHPKAVKGLGVMLFQQHRLSEALPYLQRALRSAPRDAWVTYAMAFCLSETGRRREATPYFHRYLELAPEGEMAKHVQKWLKKYDR